METPICVGLDDCDARVDLAGCPLADNVTARVIAAEAK